MAEDQGKARPPNRGVPRTINDPDSAVHVRDDGAPSTLAVALADDPDRPDAPRVVASGKGWVAEQILTLAFESGVRVRQDAALVQILAAMDLDAEIPLEAYTAVSEILAYVYRLNQSMTPPPDPPLEPSMEPPGEPGP